MSVPLNPAVRQYVEIKSRYRDCILFFRMGDFYEMFFEDAGQKGIFRREVTEVVTPGLVFSEECLDARGNNFLAAVRFAAPFACAALDATTGEFFHEACGTEEALADALFRLGP